MAVAEQFWEGYFPVDKVAVGRYYPVIICIGKCAGAMLYNLYPFCFRPENDARALKEKGFFLYAATVGHYKAGVFL